VFGCYAVGPNVQSEDRRESERSEMVFMLRYSLGGRSSRREEALTSN